MSDVQQDEAVQNASSDKGYEEFEIGEHQIPWFLWVFFTFIILWASVSWVKFFGY